MWKPYEARIKPQNSVSRGIRDLTLLKKITKAELNLSSTVNGISSIGVSKGAKNKCNYLKESLKQNVILVN